MSAKDSLEPKSFPGQHPGEKIEIVFRQHPIVMRKAMLFGMVFVLLAVTPLYFFPLAQWAYRFMFLFFIFTAGYWFYWWISWFYSVYIVTDQRILEVKQKGFFNRKVREFRLEKVQNVNYHIKGLQAVLLRYGDITVQTYVGDMHMSHIHHPAEMHERILRVVKTVPSMAPDPD